MDEPWEALDVDYSDIRSLLRPCKRLRQLKPSISASPTTPTSGPEPFLRPYSHRSSPQTLHEQDRGRIIPVPAEAIQSAMLQKTCDREKEYISGSQDIHGNLISTQEYIRRAVVSDFDAMDSDRSVWLAHGGQVSVYDWSLTHATTIRTHLNFITVLRILIKKKKKKKRQKKKDPGERGIRKKIPKKR